MSCHSDKPIKVRVSVKEFDNMNMEYKYIRAEIVAEHEAPFYLFKGFDYKHQESVIVEVSIRDFKTNEPRGLYMVSVNHLSIVMDKLRIVLHNVIG